MLSDFGALGLALFHIIRTVRRLFVALFSGQFVLPCVSREPIRELSLLTQSMKQVPSIPFSHMTGGRGQHGKTVMVEQTESKDKRSPLYPIGTVLIILGLVFVLVFGFLQPPHSCPLQQPDSAGCVIPADLFAIGAAYFWNLSYNRGRSKLDRCEIFRSLKTEQTIVRICSIALQAIFWDGRSLLLQEF